MTSLLASNEIKYHYTDYLRCYNINSIKKIIEFYKNKINMNNIYSITNLIVDFEIESTNIFQSKNYFLLFASFYL